MKYTIEFYKTNSPTIAGSVHKRFIVRDSTGKKVTKDILKSIKSRKMVFQNNSAIYDKKTVEIVKNVLQIK